MARPQFSKPVRRPSDELVNREDLWSQRITRDVPANGSEVREFSLNPGPDGPRRVEALILTVNGEFTRSIVGSWNMRPEEVVQVGVLDVHPGDGPTMLQNVVVVGDGDQDTVEVEIENFTSTARNVTAGVLYRIGV